MNQWPRERLVHADRRGRLRDRQGEPCPRPVAHLGMSAGHHCGGSRPISLMASRKAATPTRFEIICRDCGDDPRWEYQDVPPRLQRLRGPYWLMAGAAKYEAHIAWHNKLTRAQR